MVKLGVGSEDLLLTEKGFDFVEVFFARSRSEADRCCRRLEAVSIPAQVESAASLPSECGVAVLVPSTRLVEASEILTRMAHDDEDEDFEIDDDDEDDDYGSDDDLEFDGDDDDDEFDDDDADEPEEDDDF
ncbi:MAG: hypothetical protein KF841_09720 [Phycisphaerae bacterium]|nr:hypothetical protein [Phycisphaerae bacterium]